MAVHTRASAVLGAAALLLLVPGAAVAHDHHHGGWRPHVWFGVGPWWGPAPWWYYPPAYYEGPAPVEPPPVYIEREPGGVPPPGYWYYCESAGAYYPSVETCPEPWLQIPPRAAEPRGAR